VPETKIKRQNVYVCTQLKESILVRTALTHLQNRKWLLFDRKCHHPCVFNLRFNMLENFQCCYVRPGGTLFTADLLLIY